MDPITIGIIAVVAGFASSAGAVEQLGRTAARVRRNVRFEDYYPKSARHRLEIPYGDKIYTGKNVEWIGVPGEMFKADPRYITHIDGNIFDPKKLRSVVEGISRSDRPVRMFPPYGQIMKIDVDDVEESLLYEELNQGRPLTTGDRTADDFLRDPDLFSEEEQEEIRELLEELEEQGSGDLGKWRVTTRDGNHRTFGAILAGEPYIWVRLYDNDMIDVRRAQQDPSLQGRHWDSLRELGSLLE